MRSRLLILLLIVFISGFSYADSGTLKIELSGDSSLNFCLDSVQFSKMVKIEGDSVRGGLKVSVVNYKAGTESLACKDTNPSIHAVWNSGTGTLDMEGYATVEEFEQAIENTWYYNLNAIPDTIARQIAISLNDADFLPATGHFYQFIQQWDIQWTEAKAAADAKSLYGMQGYLATITSKAENDFIWTKISGVGWIGATDDNTYSSEGKWIWATGPEAGMQFWQGDYNGRAVNGAYSYWSSGEPNNSYPDVNGGLGEDYAHITQDPGQAAKSWNDLRDAGDGPGSQYYRPKGYVIEYGGMTGDAKPQLSTSFQLKIRKVIFSNQVDRTICRFDSVGLNQISAGEYLWSPTEGLSDPTISNPQASPDGSKTFTVHVNYDGCKASANFKVNVHPVPLVDLGEDQDICQGTRAALKAVPSNPDRMTSYLWNTGSTDSLIEVASTGRYSVQVRNQYSCSSRDTVELMVHDYPKIVMDEKDLLYCDTLKANLLVGVDKGSVRWTSSSDLLIAHDTLINSVVEATRKGLYQAYLQVTDAYHCVSRDTVNLRFFSTPSTTLSIDSAYCSGYNLEVAYEGDASVYADFDWYFPDTLYAAGTGLTNLTIRLGFQQTSQRKLGLQVSENGCQSELDWTPVRVIPNLEVTVDTTEGCMPLAVHFKAITTEDIDTYTWEFGDGLGNSTNQDTISHIYDYAGTYDVTLTIGSTNGCTNNGTLKDFITVHPLRTAYTDVRADRCYPQEFDVNYIGSGTVKDTYLWDLSALDPVEIIRNPGTLVGPLTIRLKNKPEATIGLQVRSEYGCEGELKTYTFKRQPWFELTADPAAGCAPLNVNMSAAVADPVDQLNYAWNTGIREGVTGETVSEQYSQSGTEYWVSAVATSSLTGCVDTAWLDRSVKVHANPLAAFDVDQGEKSISDAVFRFSNLSEGASGFEWDFGNGQTSTNKSPETRYSDFGWFTVFLLAENNFGCLDTVSRKVLVTPEDLFAPNALNPNSSNPENRVFLLATKAVQPAGYHLLIFNRWGEQVFESADMTVGWDGKMKNGNVAPAGTYIWTLTYLDVFDEPHKQSGTVVLVL